jgi:hypothetical protein
MTDTRFARTFAIALAALAVGAASGPALAQQRIDEGTTIASDAYIRVYSEAAGSVRVVGWEHDSMAVTGTKDSGVGRFSFGGADDAAKTGVWKEGDSAGEAHLEVHVPAGATVWVKVTEASVEIGEVSGGVDAYSVSGDIRISGSPSQVYAESMGGVVEIVGSMPSARAKTGSSPITFRGEAADVSFNTVGGTITVTGPSLRAGHLESVTGDILFDGEMAKGSSVGFESHSGRIELRLRADQGADFTLTSIEGEFESDFELEEAADREGMRGKQRQFSIGKAYATVTIRTFSGPVVLRRK